MDEGKRTFGCLRYFRLVLATPVSMLVRAPADSWLDVVAAVAAGATV